MIIIFLLSTISFVLIFNLLLKKQYRVKRRIEQLISQPVVEAKVEKEKKEGKESSIKTLIEMLSKNIKTSENRQTKLVSELESAGILLKAEEFIVIRVIVFGLSFAAALVMGSHFLVSLIVGLAGWKIPSIFLSRKKNARIEAFAAQLPQALETMANSMKSGFSFMQSMQLVSKEMPAPIGIEFQKTIKEINLGISMETAFENLLQRIPDKDLEIVVTAVLIQRSTGGNLAHILETIYETISERVRMKDELKALTSQGRMSAIVISLLPVAIGLILNVMNPEYFTPMLSHPLGWALLGGGLFSGVLGWIFIKKVVTIEV